MKPSRYQIARVPRKGFYVRFKRGLSFRWDLLRNSRGKPRYFRSIEKAHEAMDLLVKKHALSQQKAKETVVYEERYGRHEGLDVVACGGGPSKVITPEEGQKVRATNMRIRGATVIDKIIDFQAARRSFEAGYCRALLSHTDGNITSAARVAKKDRKDFHDLLRRCGVKAVDFRPGQRRLMPRKEQS